MRSALGMVVVVVTFIGTAEVGARELEDTVAFPASPRIFGALFSAQPGAARAAPARPSLPWRRYRVPEGCPQCDRGATHLVAGSPRLTRRWLARHAPEANGGEFGDNTVVADFWYDAVHRRVFTRSLVLHEVSDPADLRLGRAAGDFPHAPDPRQRLDPGTTVGHVGFVSWTPNGFGSYFAALQGAVRDVGTGFLDLSTVTGRSGVTRTGSMYDPNDLIKHVRLHPSGQLELGFETEPAAAPDPLLLVRGNQEVEGTLTVRSSGGNVPHACDLQQITGNADVVTATCAAGGLALSGGGTCAAGALRASYPSQSSSIVDGWTIACTAVGAHTAFVVCCAQ